MSQTRTRARLVPAATVLLVYLSSAATMARPLDVAPWLVDLGKDYPRTAQAGVGDADAEITLLLMQAANRLDPNLSDAWLWQFDMLSALDRPEAAREALGHYVEHEPADMAAYLHWIGLEIDRLQTAEQRAQFCTTQLARTNLPSKVASDLHRRLAEFHLNRGQRDQALAEAKAAVAAYDQNFNARDLLERLQTDVATASSPSSDPPPLKPADLQIMLSALSASPNDPGLACDLADELVQQNMIEPAERLYAHAVALLRRSDPQGHLPGALIDDAGTLRLLGRDAEADKAVQEAGQQWRTLLAQAAGAFSPELLADAAWFYAHFELQPEQAEKLARMSLAELPDDLVARRALGAALQQQGKVDEAKAELAKVADRDAAAAAEYARLLSAQKQTDLARQTVEHAATRPADATGRLLLSETRRRLNLKPATSQPAAVEVAAALAAFNWAVLDYPLHPDKYLSLSMSVPRREMSPAEPWLLTAQLKNIGTFPITVGAGLMVAPDLLMAVSTAGDKTRSTGATIRGSFNRVAQLMPGETVAITQNVKLGVVRAGMIGTPQQTQEVTVNAVLSPARGVNAQGEEVWMPDLGGLAAQVQFRRAALPVDAGTVPGLIQRTRGADVFDRIAALELLSMLLAEQQHIQAGRLQYFARPIDAAAVQAAILACAADGDARVRARLAECLRWFALDKDATHAATRMLSDTDWLVRGLTFRALADHYGAKFEPILKRAAEADPDEWVRRTAAALQSRIAAATLSPASQPAESAPAQ